MHAGNIEKDKDGNKIEGKPNEMEVFLWKITWETTNELRKAYLKYQEMVNPLVIGQCSPALRAQLEGTKGFDAINTKQDVIKILICHADMIKITMRHMQWSHHLRG